MILQTLCRLDIVKMDISKGDNTMKTVFQYKRTRGAVLSEEFRDGDWFLSYREAGKENTLLAYSVADLEKQDIRNPWDGRTPEEILASGRDILAEGLLSRGEPDYIDVKSILPPLREGAYSFLSGTASWGGVIVRAFNGGIYPQQAGGNRRPEPLFTPVEVDAQLGKLRPKQFLLDGRMPVMFSVHCDGNNVLEFLYFVEPGDPDRDPIVWIRTKRYQKADPENFHIDYRMAAFSREVKHRMLPEEQFLETLGDTVAFWLRFQEAGTCFEIPEQELSRVIDGTQMACATTFSGDHAHYGHGIYGEEVHDNFPPNYCWSLEAMCLLNRQSWAKRIWQHLMHYLLTDEGRFFYRQGEEELFGASAVEYSQLLFLANRYHKQLGAAQWDPEDWEKLIGFGKVLLDNCKPCAEAEGRVLVVMCAEADTNTRVHAYLNNNLWSIVGLSALAQLLERYGYKDQVGEFSETAVLLEENVRAQLRKESIQNSRFGNLPPFRFGYTAEPATLSICRDTFHPMTDAEHTAYMVVSNMRAQGTEQDLTENTYANYRYYPEMLSAMMLEDEQAEAIRKMRENIGGEILGMIRYMGHIDDWPVLHYARYLLEMGYAEKYILLLYAHTCHHGHPELMCYYEQVSLTGVVRAPDCVPSLLTTPVMAAWMFAYETMRGNRLTLLRGIPKVWFETGFSAKKVGFSDGSVDIAVKDGRVTMDFSKETAEPVELVWRAKDKISLTDLEAGREYVSAISGNCLTLKAGITHAELVIR